MWTLLLLLTVLLQGKVVCRPEDEQGSFPCGLSSEDIGSFVDSSRVWKVDDGALKKHDIQEIVNCTEEGDVISLQTTKTIQPHSRIEIPWQLTFTSSVNGTQNVVNADLKATMTCPSGSGLFLLKSAGVVLRNVIISGCDLAKTDDVAGIIETEACPSNKDGWNSQMDLRLQHVDFTSNRNLGGSLISVTDPDCYNVVMRNVLFHSNQYGRQSQLSISNDMRDVTLSKNGVFEGNTSLFYFPPASNTIADRTAAEDNTGTLFFIDRASIDIQNSQFKGNSAFKKGVIFAIISEVSISSTSFVANHCDQIGAAVSSLNMNNESFSSASFVNSNTCGSTISVSDPRNVKISNCVFESNNAGHGSEDSGGALQIDGGDSSSKNKSIQILDCIFRNNFAFKSGGIVVNSIHKSEILISNSTFETNTAGSDDDGGALSFLDSTDCTLQVIASRFKSNSAVVAGAIYIDSFLGNMTFLDSEFNENKANSDGGAVHIIHSSGNVKFHCSEFKDNKANSGGAIRIYKLLGNMAFLDSEFKDNKANSGGAICIYKLSGKSTFLDSEFTENKALHGGAIYTDILSEDMTFQNSKFRANSALDGSAIYILSSLGDLKFLESEFKSNHAFGGGAIQIISLLEDMTFLDSKFEENRAGKSGGAILIESLSGRLTFGRSKCSQNQAGAHGGAIHISSSLGDMKFLDSEFNANKADKHGGAIYIIYSSGSSAFQTCEFKENSADADGGAVYIEDSENLMVENSVFVSNQATCGGGALLLDDCKKFAIEHCIFVDNKAITGGATGFKSSSAEVDSTTFLRNYAKSGGGLYSSMGELSIGDCTFESNKAELYGGGMHTIASQKGKVTLRSSNVLTKNEATMGGGAFFQLDYGYQLMLHSSVTIHSSVRFESNRAYRAGGSFFIDSIDGLDGYLNCSHPLDQVIPFSSDKDLNTINVSCCVMKNNSVGEDGYGPNIATAATSFYLTVFDQEKKDYIVGDVVNITGYKSGDQLPIFQVTTFDHFNQGPAITKSRTVLNISVGVILLDYNAFAKATIASQNSKPRDSLLPGALVTDVSSGIGNIVVGAPLQKPKTYPLVLWVGDDKSANIQIDVTLRNCGINEASAQRGTLCEECDSNHYSFDVENGSCEPCPDDCDCTQWGITPTKEHWLSAPCSTEVMDCLSNTACNYDGREERLNSFFETTNPTCELDKDEIDSFHELQCRKGREGLLCGSCSDAYGRRQYECAKCEHYALVILSLLGRIAWNFVVSAIAIAGNLPTLPGGRLERRMHMRRISERYPFLGSSENIQEGSIDSDACEVARLNVTESFKLLLNFAQVCSIALAVNADWTNLVSEALTSLDIVGAATGEMTLSLDCLFSSSSSVPRSICRVIISLLVPLLVLGLFSVYWLVTVRNDRPVLRRRLVLSTVVVFYVSYIGWVKTLSSALNCVTISSGFVSDRYWAEDTSVRCFEGSHLALVCALVIPMILTVLLGFPVCSAVYLHQEKLAGRLADESVKEKYGFMYRVYSEAFIYWECVTLLRKALLALIIVFGVGLGANMQALICACVLIFFVYFHAKFLPYSQDYASLNSIEALSLLVCAIVFLSGPFLEDDNITQGGRNAVSILAVALICSFALYFLHGIYQKITNFCSLSLKKDFQTVQNGDNGFKVIFHWIKYRYKTASSQIGRVLEPDDL